MDPLRAFMAVLTALAAALVMTGAAGAGPLSSGQLSVTATGPRVPTSGVTLTASTTDPTAGALYTDGIGSVAAGNAFAAAQEFGLTTNPAVTALRVSVGSNGRIRIDPSASPANISITAPFAVTLRYQNPYGTLLTVPLSPGLGSAANPAVVTRVAKIPLVGNFLVTLTATGWHTGAVHATGLTVSGAPIPDVTLQGSSSRLSPYRDVGLVTLVSLARVHISGLWGVSNIADSVTLRLSWDNTAGDIVDPLPEAGSGLLLAAAAAGLVARRRARQRAAVRAQRPAGFSGPARS